MCGIPSYAKEPTEEINKQIKIFTKSLTGQQDEYEVSSILSIEDFKQLIADKRGCGPCEIRLIFNGKCVYEPYHLCTWDIQEGNIVYVLYRLRGG
eukprot:403367968